MKGTIIAILGSGGKGKSTTIIKINETLQKKYPNAKVNYLKPKGPGDIIVTITIEKVKIGIGSGGDIEKVVKDNLKLFLKEGCNIIICATRTSGGTEQAVHNFAKRNKYQVIWSTNYTSDNFNEELCAKLNQICAENIISFSVYSEKWIQMNYCIVNIYLKCHHSPPYQ